MPASGRQRGAQMLIASLIILQVFIFAGLIFMLRKIMTENVSSATRHLDELNQDYAKKEEEVNRQLERIKAQSQEMVSRAQEEAAKLKEEAASVTEKKREEIIAQARTQADDIIQQADKSRQKLLADLDEQISKEATAKACELINYTLPEKFKQDVHAHWIDELIESGFGNMENLRIPEEVSEVKIASAFALTEEQRKKLAKKVREVLGKEIPIKEEVAPAICAGLTISIGSLVLDGSLRNKIQEQIKNVQRASQ
jgi:F-type H+-transporting ATPase subunit b